MYAIAVPNHGPAEHVVLEHELLNELRGVHEL